MTLSKKFFLAFVILVSAISVYSQDLIYTVRGEYNSNSLALDAILVENLSNGTQLLFESLPNQSDYKINLTTGEQVNPTGFDIYQMGNHLSVVKNIPGNISLSVQSNKLHYAMVTVFNIQGQALWANKELQIRSGQQIDIQLPGGAIYIVEVVTEFGTKAYRAAGSLTQGSIRVSLDGKGINNHSALKSTTLNSLSDFNFQTGDDLRVTAFKEGYYSRPAEFKIVGSGPVEFLFDISRIEVDGISDVYVSLADESDIPDVYDPSTGVVKLEATDKTRELIKGDIITVDADTAGYLRKVVEITEEDGKVVLETEQAYMDELFVDKSFKLNTTMLEAPASLKGTSSLVEITSALTDEQGYIHPVKIILYNSEGKAITKSVFGQKGSADEIRRHIVDKELDFSMTDLYGEEGDNIHFFISEGLLRFKTDAVFEFDFDYQGEFTEDTKVKKGDLRLFEFYLEATTGVHTKLELDMSKSWDNDDEDDPVHLFKIAQARAKFVVPPGVPVWIDFDLDMYRDIILHADASLHADWGFEINDTLKVGGRYTRATKELTPISEFKHHAEIFPLNLEGEINASARLELFPRVEMKLYSLFGPYAEIVPYIQGNYNAYGQIQITPSGTESFLAWNAGLDLGLDLRVGTTFKLLAFERDFGPKVISFSESPLPVWKSPYIIELLTDLPEELEPGSTHSLLFKVSDMLGLAVSGCPIHIDGDGIFNKYIELTGLDGKVAVDWTIGETEGIYEFTATIFNADKTGADYVNASLTATNQNPPTADFTSNRTTVEIGESILFTDMSINNPTSWSWDFGDGGTSLEQNPTHIYTIAGNYTISLTVTNESGSDIEIKSGYITIDEDGNDNIFNPDLTYGTMTDIDGNIYKTIQIGTQVWMAENLKYLPSVSPSSEESDNIPLYYIYDYQGTNLAEAKVTDNFVTYGTLYNWPAAIEACPAGWHLPSVEEWTELDNYLANNGFNFDGTIGGGSDKIGKAMASDFRWEISATPGAIGNKDYPDVQNLSGFSALPAGFAYIASTAGFTWVEWQASFWSSTQKDNYQAFLRYLNFDNTELSLGDKGYYPSKRNGYSVRCVKD